MACKNSNADCKCNRCQLGWHSRRHETRDAQDVSRVRYAERARHRPMQRWDSATSSWVKVPSVELV